MNPDSLRTLFTDKRSFIMRLILLFCLGVVLLVASTFMGRDDPYVATQSTPITERQNEPTIAPSDEIALERRLSEILSLVEGAGTVEVMLTFSQSREVILAQDTTINESSIKEEDSAGGTRESHTLANDARTILLPRPGGGQEPIILREIVPKVEGVIIVSEGGDNVFVREALIRAAMAVLGVDIHRVQVLQMNVETNNNAD